MDKIIAVSTVIGCKNFCNYCPQNKVIKEYSKRSKISVMSFETFKTCIDKLPKETIINFSGFSEPCLNPEYVKMILYANEKGHKIQLLTTIVGMKFSDIIQLEKVPFLRFLVHLPDNQAQTKIDVSDNFVKVIDKLLKSTINIEWKFHQSPNENEDVHPKLNKFTLSENKFMRSLKFIIPKKSRENVRNVLCNMNKKMEIDFTESEKYSELLIEKVYKKCILNLEKLINRDLSHWLKAGK